MRCRNDNGSLISSLYFTISLCVTDRVLMSLSFASDLQLNPNAMAPDTANRNMKVLLWNVEGTNAM